MAIGVSQFLGRRGFLKFFLAALARAGILGSFSSLVACKDSDKDTTAISKAPIPIAKLDSLKPGFNEFGLVRVGVFLSEEEGRKKLSAVSMLCTHQTCAIAFEGSRFKCPCHGSQFSRTGQRLSGPARKPLRWLKLSVSEKQELYLHPWEEVAPEWKLEVG